MSPEEKETRRLARRTYHKNKKATLKKSFLDAKRKPCVDCKRTFPPICMDFDHREPSEKIMDVGTMVVGRYSRARVLKEMEKCDLVCANCHRIRTAKQQGWTGLDT